MILKLWLNNIQDPIRKNFEWIEDYTRNQEFLKFDAKFLKFTTNGAVTDFQLPHNLKFVPLDVITTAQTGNIVFNYDKFTDKFISITTTGAVSFRGLIGRYRENNE